MCSELFKIKQDNPGERWAAMNLDTWYKYCLPNRTKNLNPAKKRDVNVTVTIRIASTTSFALACSAPQQKIANMYNPTEVFALPA